MSLVPLYATLFIRDFAVQLELRYINFAGRLGSFYTILYRGYMLVFTVYYLC
jgi:hypothetical protein